MLSAVILQLESNSNYELRRAIGRRPLSICMAAAAFWALDQ